MKTNLNLDIVQLSRENLENIKVICFDGDGVTKRKGTDFIFENGQLVTESYSPTDEIKDKLLKLSKRFHVTFSSGRAMQYLKNIYNEELMGENGSLQAEIGMYLWWKGQLWQNFEINDGQKQKIEKIRKILESLSNKAIRGFEPKEYLITMHAFEAVPEVEDIVRSNDPEGDLYCWWNEEAYDIGLKTVNKATGLKKLVEKLGFGLENVMTVGNGINDENMTAVAGLDVSTDPKHLSADFVAYGEELGGLAVVNILLELV